MRQAAQLFVDCLRRCGEVYVVARPHQYAGTAALMGDNGEDESCAGAGVSAPQATNDCASNDVSWEALAPYRDALLLAVEAATCILTLDHSDPVVVANPVELRK